MFFTYVLSGFNHVLPLGFDHVLFIVALFFLSKNALNAFQQAFVFTVAHSITLALTVLGFIHFSTAWTECLIAVSIFIVALENITQPIIAFSRYAVVFVFGLLHGLGFANALAQQDLPSTEMVSALFGFNVGVEIAQALIILFLYFGVAKPLAKHPNYRRWIVTPVSILIAAIALFWSVERFLNV